MLLPMAEVNAFLEQLEAEKARLKNSVGHLERSIGELKEAISEHGDEDREFKKAIEENIVVIAKNRARIELLDEEIGELKQGIQNLGGNMVSVPVTAPPPPPAAGNRDNKNDESMPDAGNTNEHNNSGMYL